MQLEFNIEPQSYWQQGVDDARAGLPLRPSRAQHPGYTQGWNFGVYGNRSWRDEAQQAQRVSALREVNGP